MSMNTYMSPKRMVCLRSRVHCEEVCRLQLSCVPLLISNVVEWWIVGHGRHDASMASERSDVCRHAKRGTSHPR